jgi:acetyl-CoA C-acetyltransferase
VGIMPEAVYRTSHCPPPPSGRAVKGSLRDLRPDDLAATIVDAALTKVAEGSTAP